MSKETIIVKDSNCDLGQRIEIIHAMHNQGDVQITKTVEGWLYAIITDTQYGSSASHVSIINVPDKEHIIEWKIER
jgi:hypothetical protein